MIKCDYCAIPRDTLRYEKFNHRLLSGRMTINGMEIGDHFYRRLTNRDEN
jgi:hypothetical protein